MSGDGQRKAAPARPETPLYDVPAALEVRPWRVVLVAPRAVPRWLADFRELARRQRWLDLVMVRTDVAAPQAGRDANAGLRIALAAERCLHRDDATRLTSLAPDGDDGGPATLEAVGARVASLCPDLVLLAWDSDAWAAVLAASAPAGCWRLGTGLTDPRVAGLSLLGPLLRGDPATPVELVLDTPTGDRVEVAGSRARTRTVSFLATRNDAFRKLPPLLLRALRRAATGEVSAARGVRSVLRLGGGPEVADDPLAGPRLMATTLPAMARTLARRRRHREWAVLVRHERTPLDPAAPELGRHSVLKAPKGWWADPCVVDAGGRRLVFVEEMDVATQQAHIVCLELTGDGACILGTVLKEPGHLSFPQVFHWEGDWYMTVESGYDRRASLYRGTGFPMAWERVADLVTGWPCVDPVLHHHDGHWYLFLNVAENANSTSEDLFLFVADALAGPYRPHPASPIVCDVRRARMAGRIFRHRGRLIRPSQDCGPRYGTAVVFNQIVELGPTVYRERVLSRLQPEGVEAIEGCHSYSAADGVELLDMMGDPTAAPVMLPVTGEAHADASPRSHAVAAPGRLSLQAGAE